MAIPRASGVPDPPADLGPDGAALWARAWAVGVTWISPASDYAILAETCRVADDLAIARQVWSSRRDAGDLRAVIAASKVLSEHLSALGFTPTSRTRLGAVEVAKPDALQLLLARRSPDRPPA